MMMHAALAGLLAVAAAAPPVPETPVPVWPKEFTANFTEETWFEGGYQRTPGWVAYSWNVTSQVVYRSSGRYNPVSNAVKPGYEGPVILWSVNTSARFVVYPEPRECCLFCSQFCGALNPNWVTNAEHYFGGWVQVSNIKSNIFIIRVPNDTPTRIATATDTGNLMTMYKGGAKFPGDNPFHWLINPDTYKSYDTAVPSGRMALPSYCEGAKKCPDALSA